MPLSILLNRMGGMDSRRAASRRLSRESRLRYVIWTHAGSCSSGIGHGGRLRGLLLAITGKEPAQ